MLLKSGSVRQMGERAGRAGSGIFRVVEGRLWSEILRVKAQVMVIQVHKAAQTGDGPAGA
jgi:hypothetical protein